MDHIDFQVSSNEIVHEFFAEEPVESDKPQGYGILFRRSHQLENTFGLDSTEDFVWQNSELLGEFATDNIIRCFKNGTSHV